MKSVLLAVAVALAPTAANAQFETAKITGDVVANTFIADAGGSDGEESGGPLSGFYKGLLVSFGSDAQLGDSSANASASQNTDFTPISIVSNASVSTDVDDFEGDLNKGIASGFSSLNVVFTVTQTTPWSFPSGQIRGVHAGGSVSMYPVNPALEAGVKAIFDFDANTGDIDGASGTIPPGTYQFIAQISANTNVNDGFNGLFAGANWDFVFLLAELPPPPECLGDADRDGLVSFPDIIAVLANWANDYSPGSGVGDADYNGLVEFPDVISVLANWGDDCKPDPV